MDMPATPAGVSGASPTTRAWRLAGASGLLFALALVMLYFAVGVLAAGFDWPIPRWLVPGVPWPFAWRYDADLPVSPYVWRKLALAGGFVTAGVMLVWYGLWHRRRRWRWLALAAGILLVANASWPRPALYLSPALPTSFERSYLPYTPDNLLQGRLAYQAQCASCHGVAADGQGPRAASLARWPSTLGESLFQNRLEGEIYWRIAHHPLVGTGPYASPAPHAGTAPLVGTEPHASPEPLAGAEAASNFGAEPHIGGDTAWRIVDYLRAIAYGASGGAGMPSVPAPEILLSCRGRGHIPLSALRGQLVRVVAHGPATAQDERDDPRLVTVVLTRGAAVDAECTNSDAAAWDAYALLAGTQFLVDRQGWLRARHVGGNAPAWTSGDDVCGPSGRLHVAVAVQGLDQILKAMDASPIPVDRYRRR
ncbi:c-type cytochrome [Bordetella sp. LUAb4]|uniref:c-type cytochrome n=1 Tax=Bordetella sp. LUAb4 TaxID=2843195 RepID=UPI001E39879F|nr:c-type cytochrome [Bordetella sp. LUAb4]